MAKTTAEEREIMERKLSSKMSELRGIGFKIQSEEKYTINCGNNWDIARILKIADNNNYEPIMMSSHGLKNEDRVCILFRRD